MSGSGTTTILRKVYAYDSNTGENLSSGKVLLTNGLGGTSWVTILSTLTLASGPVVGTLPSTISSFSTLIYTTTQYFGGLSSMSTDIYTAISSLGNAITTALPAAAANNSLVSTSVSLGSLGYISTASLTSSLAGTSRASVASTISTNTSTLGGLGALGYISSATLRSTVAGLGTASYVSTPTLTAALLSTVAGLGSASYISTPVLLSTVAGLGSASYLSTPTLNLALTSTVNGLGTRSYVSTLSLVSTTLFVLTAIANVTPGTGSAASYASTVAGLGSSGFISTSALVSTTYALSTQRANINFDRVGTMIVSGQNTLAINGSGNTINIIYISSFIQSSISYIGPTTGVPLNPQSTTVDMVFSTAQIDFNAFAMFMNSTSRVTIDVYPSIAFSKLSSGASRPTILPISTMLQYGANLLSSPCVTSYLYVGNTQVYLENRSVVDASNFYTTPIKLSVPPSTLYGQTANPYTLVHLMPSSLNYGQYQNALHNSAVTPFFSPTGSVFVSVQNIPTN